MPKLTTRTELATAPAVGDLLHIVDIDDPTDDPAGTSKKIQITNLFDDLVHITGDETIDGAKTFNDSQADKDTLIKGLTDALLLNIDAGLDRVGIGKSSPTEKLDVNGNILSGVSGQDGVQALYDASAVLQVFLNSNGNSYLNNGNLGLGTKTPNTQLTVNGDASFKRTASAVDYNPSAATTDYLIVITDTSIARAVTISTEDIQSGTTSLPRFFIIKDESGNAGTNNITISGESGNIDGAANFPIATDYGSITIYADGTNLWII